MAYLLLACLLGLPDCVWSYDCMKPTRDLVNGCIDECYVEFGWNRVRRACNAAERACERERFFDCFEGPIPHDSWRCEVVASDGTMWCKHVVRLACEAFDYDNDGDVDLYDYSRWKPGQWHLVR